MLRLKDILAAMNFERQCGTTVRDDDPFGRSLDASICRDNLPERSYTPTTQNSPIESTPEKKIKIRYERRYDSKTGEPLFYPVKYEDK